MCDRATDHDRLVPPAAEHQHLVFSPSLSPLAASLRAHGGDGCRPAPDRVRPTRPPADVGSRSGRVTSQQWLGPSPGGMTGAGRVAEAGGSATISSPVVGACPSCSSPGAGPTPRGPLLHSPGARVVVLVPSRAALVVRPCWCPSPVLVIIPSVRLVPRWWSMVSLAGPIHSAVRRGRQRLRVTAWHGSAGLCWEGGGWSRLGILLGQPVPPRHPGADASPPTPPAAPPSVSPTPAPATAAAGWSPPRPHAQPIVAAGQAGGRCAGKSDRTVRGCRRRRGHRRAITGPRRATWPQSWRGWATAWTSTGPS